MPLRVVSQCRFCAKAMALKQTFGGILSCPCYSIYISQIITMLPFVLKKVAFCVIKGGILHS